MTMTLYNCEAWSQIKKQNKNKTTTLQNIEKAMIGEKFQKTRRMETLVFDKGCCSWVSWSIKQQVFVLCRRHGQGSELQRAVSSHWATEQVGDRDWLLSAQPSAAVFTAFVCCSLSSRRYVYVCVCVCCSLCGPGRTGNFLCQCVGGFWLELCWSCLCWSRVVVARGARRLKH